MASSGDEEPPKAQGEAAHKTLRKHFPTLMKIVASGDIVENLYAEEIIKESTFEVVTAPSTVISDKQKGTKIIKDVQVSVHSKPKAFEAFCQILKSEGHDDVVSKLQESFQEYLKNPPKDYPELTGTNLSNEFQQLKEDLAFYNKQLSREIGDHDKILELVKSLIQAAIENALKTGEELDSVKRQMNSLCYITVSVPTRLSEWAVQEVNNVYERLSSRCDASNAKLNMPLTQESKENSSLFSDETLYHSSVCCLAVNKCSASNFRDTLNVSGHHLQAASMTIFRESLTDRSLIAFQGNVMYVAFQSEPTIAHWLQSSYSSFEEGFKKQLSSFPLRFFVEQLGEQKKIVFTGYLFGGMLACYVAANLWKENCVTLDVLQRNVICITFGQPLIELPFVNNATDRFSEAFKRSVHTYFSHDDPLPFLLRYFCGSQGDNGLRSPLSTTEFSDPACRQFLHSLTTIMTEKSYSVVTAIPTKAVDQALTDLKKQLNTITDKVKLPFAESEMVCLEGSDLIQVWRENGNTANDFESLLTKKNNMEVYYKKTKVYFGSGKGSLPLPSPKKELKNVSLLKPLVKGVELHKFPSEHAVVVEGENLWFCHEILLGEGRNVISITNPMESVSRHVIQFNYPPTEKTDIIARNGLVRVTLNSYFASSIWKQVKVEQKPHEFSLRQMQLARCTPTEVICLAYWSAVLEQHSNIEANFQQSQRLKKIREFLEEAVKVVPLESILNAIAFAEDKIAIKCAEALIESKVTISPSVEALGAIQLGAVRTRTGLHGIEALHLVESTLKAMGVGLDELITLSASSSTELELKYLSSAPRSPLFVSGSTSYAAAATHPFPPGQLVTPIKVAVEDLILKREVRNDKIADKLSEIADHLTQNCLKFMITDYLSNKSIERIYPMIDTHTRHSLYSTSLQPPLDVLHTARMQIEILLEELHDDLDSNPDHNFKPSNERMLDVLKDINDNSLKVCAALLGSFMEQKVSIPLVQSENPMDMENILEKRSSPVAMGVWVLFSLGYPELHAKLSSLRGHPLMVEITDYIYGVLSDSLDVKRSTQTSQYDAKLQFLLQGMKRIVSCSSRYISYSLERQLCSNLKFDKSIPVKELVANWDHIFKGDALSLVAGTHRSLIARWLKWAILIHDLREALAEYTCVGVTGLMNSGKSQLVSKLFGIQTLVGTTKRKRTTVPLLYNLDGKVNGLDVIDFPGVDDKEFSIPKLATLLLGLLQVVIFVVHHDRATSAVSLEWLKFLKTKEITVIVCITHGDVLYFEEEDRRKSGNVRKGKDEIIEEVRREIGSEIYGKRKELRELTDSDLDSLNLYYFHLPSVYQDRVGDLRDAGILEIKDVANELTKILKQYSPDLSERFNGFAQKGDQFALLPLIDKDDHSAPASASLFKQIPFIDPVVVFKCDSTGGKYLNEAHGISVTIPKNAIPEGQVVHFEIAVTLHGSFKFADGKRPISPILWICTKEKVSFKKLIEVKLPHFLSGLTRSELSHHGASFAKADHSTAAAQKTPIYDFVQCRTKQEFVTDETGSYATLESDHCCFMCIQANHSKELMLKAGYCLSRVEYRLSPSRYAIHFCATFMLDSCMRAMTQQYEDKECSINCSEFKFSIPNSDGSDIEPHIKLIRPIGLDDSCEIALDPKKGQIRASSIDFWTKNYDLDGMKLRHRNLLYPPRIKMTLVLKASDLILPVSFQGCTDDSDVDAELPITGVPTQVYKSSSTEFESSTRMRHTKHTDTGLSIDDQFAVTQYLDPMEKRDIIRLGTALGLSYPDLRKMDNLPDDMVYAWLMKKDNVIEKGLPTWTALATTLRKINQNGIAQEIEQKQLGKK